MYLIISEHVEKQQGLSIYVQYQRLWLFKSITCDNYVSNEQISSYCKNTDRHRVTEGKFT